MRPPVTTVKMSTMRPTAASGQETFSAFEVQRDQAADEDEAKRLWTSVPGYHCHNAIDKDPRSEGDSSLRRALVLNERRTSCTVCQMRKRMIRPKSFSMNGPNGKVFFLVTFYAFAKYADKEPRLKQISTEEVKPDGIIIKVFVIRIAGPRASRKPPAGAALVEHHGTNGSKINSRHRCLQNLYKSLCNSRTVL
ncbi:uncharacterized protein LOC108158945 isoform X3 [Drosophila miranda]|uniref:uncharacterized protein LOC108158945 isoform X3 n=1 Tax=Drosophila miranda TaxID=7229 RepID=UPI0007E648DB|nr:uncharacterized protein LOC108158945 isoform X3 [Drosophila miranda]